MNEDIPVVACPKCGATQEDFDGFGVVNCEVCDYCKHPSSVLDDHGNEHCGICDEILN